MSSESPLWPEVMVAAVPATVTVITKVVPKYSLRVGWRGDCWPPQPPPSLGESASWLLKDATVPGLRRAPRTVWTL